MAKRIQGTDDGEAVAIEHLPDDADRALSIVASKLDTRLSVEYKVNQLISEATNVSNLARIFHGEGTDLRNQCPARADETLLKRSRWISQAGNRSCRLRPV